MNTMIEMRLEVRKQGGCERFSCNLVFWTLMVELGEAFGWKPFGSTYVATSIKGVRGPQTLRHDYEPGVWRDAKRIETQDASGWADALSAARASPHLNNLTQSHRSSIGQQHSDADNHDRKSDAAFLEAMDEFIQYLHKGAFSFAAGDDDEIPLMSARK
jgi:hypothetical protein